MIRLLKQLRNRWNALFGLDTKRDELDAEVAHHLDLLASDFEREGMSPEKARRAAQLRFGGVETLKEECQERWGVLWIENTIRDLKHSMKQVVKLPGFTVLIVFTLALGIGACTTIYSVMQATILSPLPVQDQDRLFVLREENPERGITEFSASYPNYLDYRDQSNSIDGMLARRGASATITIDDTPERLEATRFTSGAMKVLGWKPLLGREFIENECVMGGPPVTMISERFWRNRYTADPEIIGKQLIIDRKSHEIVGVFSDDTFVVNSEIHIWRPFIPNPENDTRGNRDLLVIGRLKAGVTLDQAQANMDIIADGLKNSYPDSNKGWEAYLKPFYDELIPPELRMGMTVLSFAVGMLLLIACANVANLLLSRATSREKEIAVRVALGAKTFRIARQLFSESAVYCLMGTIAGVIVSIGGIALVRIFSPEGFPRSELISLDWQALAFAATACVATVILSGLLPALRGSKVPPASALGSGSKAIGANRSKGRMRAGLVIFQIALSLSLVAGAGLLIKSFSQLQAIDPGFNATEALAFRVTPDWSTYGNAHTRSQYYQDLIDRIEALPGVSSVGMTSSVPFGPLRTSLPAFSQDSPAIEPDEPIQAAWRIVSPKYFDTMRIPMIEGRAFTRFDTYENERVIIISKELSDRFWPGESALGKRVMRGNRPIQYTVVGVVGSVRIERLTNGENPTMYFPSWQWTWWDTMHFIVRTNQSPESMIPEIRQLVSDIDSDQPVFDFRPLEYYLNTQLHTPRLHSWLLGTFAAIALLLASVGVYGVIASSISQRANEIGVRIALGASRSAIVSMILKQGACLLMIGLGIGGLLTWKSARFIQSQLYSVETSDASAHIVAVMLLGLAAISACVIPALRATRIQPAQALVAE